MATSLKEPKAPASSPAQGVAGASPTPGWLQRHRNQVMIASFIALIVVGLVAIAVFAAVPSGRSGNVATSAPAAGVAPSPELAEGSAPAAAPVTAPVAPVASAPIAPVAAEQKPAANVAQPSTSKGFAPGKYKLSQITTSSSNVVVAFVAAAINQKQFPIHLSEEDRFTPAKATAFAELHEKLKNPDKEDWLLVGSLQHIVTGSFLSPGDAVEGINYKASALFASPCADGSCVGFYRIQLRLYKTDSGDWRIGSFSRDAYELWDKGAFERRLSKANNEPSGLQ